MLKLIENLYQIFLEALADLEFQLTQSDSSQQQYWRKKYLQHMQIEFEKNLRFGENVYIRNKGNLFLGNRCCIGSFARIWNYAPIRIGDDFIAARGLNLNSATHDPITLQPQGLEINIGSRVWCGINVTIIAGVTIGDDVVIGAGSVVVKDIPSRCIAAGVPASKIREISREDLDLYTVFPTS